VGRPVSELHDTIQLAATNTVEIEEAIRQHPGVHDVAVVAMPYARLGEVVAAFLIPKADHQIEEAAFVAWCRKRDGSPWIQAERDLTAVSKGDGRRTGFDGTIGGWNSSWSSLGPSSSPPSHIGAGSNLR
jgi:acyl-CoA synthetase (AMP-forming)/AMP-acid ligase II